MYSVKQLADLAGVSRRTLHYYHETGVLEPDKVDERGYRWYGESALFTLQQILLFREMEMELSRIKEIMEDRDFSRLRALSEHKRVLESRRERLDRLLFTVESTIKHIKGEVKMEEKKIFEGFDRETEEKYSQEAQERWGETARESQNLWKSYGSKKQKEIMDLGNRIYTDLADCLEKGLNPDSDIVQNLLKEWHDHLRFFYEPTPEVLIGLGDMYCSYTRFRKNINNFLEGLSEFMREGIQFYVKNL
jgi:DNA-binding transcriptional MerR regulator